MKHLLIIDGMAIVFRGYFALFDRPRLRSDGLNLSALHIYLSTIHRILEHFDPSHVVVCFDSKPPTFRHKWYPLYKADRGEMPEDLAENLPYIFKLTKALNICQLRKSLWEADDIIATVVKRSERNAYTNSIYSPDKDLAQLVSDQTTLYRPGKRGAIDCFDYKRVCEEWGLSEPKQLVDVQALMGDPVDCIPGVPGIGAKTAAKLIGKYTDLENCISHSHELKGKQRENLEAYQDEARLSYKLALMKDDCPLPVKLTEMKRRAYDAPALDRICSRLEMDTLAERLLK